MKQVEEQQNRRSGEAGNEVGGVAKWEEWQNMKRSNKIGGTTKQEEE